MPGAPVSYNAAQDLLNQLTSQAMASPHYGLGEGGALDQLISVARGYLSGVGPEHSLSGRMMGPGRGIEELPAPMLLYAMPALDGGGSWGIFVQNKNLPSAGSASLRNAAF